jgi:probable blue pigment (indigoidine) exporter
MKRKDNHMKDFKDTLLTMITPMLWGSTYMITAVFIPIDRPIFVALMRGLPIGLLLLLFYHKFPKGIWLFRSILLGSLNIGIFFLLLFIAAYRLPGGIASIVGSVQPVFIIFLSWIILKEKPTANSFLAIGMIFVGVFFLFFKQQAAIDPIGVIAALIGSALMSLGVVLTKYWGKPEGVSQMVFTSWQLFFGSLILIPAFLFLEGPVPPLSTQNILGIAFIGIFNTGLAYYLWFRGIEKIGPAKASFLNPINPLTAFFLGYLMLGQTINFLQILGVIIIISSVFVSQSKRKIKKPVTATKSQPQNSFE